MATFHNTILILQHILLMRCWDIFTCFLFVLELSRLILLASFRGCQASFPRPLPPILAAIVPLFPQLSASLPRCSKRFENLEGGGPRDQVSPDLRP
ncbi:hypothetical protein F4678DRAFT_269630 [Xylaria arbuscula]|nr:hypothetical protein F4678DRAFT_269630 [Xylaria arbuscula]